MTTTTSLSSLRSMLTKNVRSKLVPGYAGNALDLENAASGHLLPLQDGRWSNLQLTSKLAGAASEPEHAIK